MVEQFLSFARDPLHKLHIVQVLTLNAHRRLASQVWLLVMRLGNTLVDLRGKGALFGEIAGDPT